MYFYTINIAGRDCLRHCIFACIVGAFKFQRFALDRKIPRGEMIMVTACMTVFEQTTGLHALRQIG
ncbi:hypothetical protein BWR19_18215 [Halomonas sp. 1513]|nr:hypothetical protein BWR19_18215 [Halomonas sp. 1513]